MVSYDDPTSFGGNSIILLNHINSFLSAAKGNYIVQSGLAGFAMWDAGGDYNDLLLDAINQQIGR
jgi:chitinase